MRSARPSALQQWFAAVDADSSGRASLRELQRALAAGGLNFSMKLVASLVRMHDANNTMALDFNEFCAMQAYLTRLQSTFSAVGGARAAHLNVQQVQQALEQLGFNLDMQPGGAFYKMVGSYDFARDGSIGLESFIALCIQLRNAQKLFNLFDEQRTGRVTLGAQPQPNKLPRPSRPRLPRVLRSSDFNQLVWTLAQL